jgi:hypothetical protein
VPESEESVSVANVFSIRDGRPVEGTLKSENDDENTAWAVEQLESVLQDMRDGNLRGFCMVMGVPNPETNVIDTIATVNSYEAYANPFLFIGGMERLKHRMNSQIDYDEDLHYDDDDA